MAKSILKEFKGTIVQNNIDDIAETLDMNHVVDEGNFTFTGYYGDQVCIINTELHDKAADLVRIISIIAVTIKEQKFTYPVNIFKTLPNYEKGFFGRACEIEAESYRTETSRIKDRILAGFQLLEEIISEEQQAVTIKQLKALFTGDDGTAAKQAQGYWSAVELIKNCLTDSKPYREGK